MIKSIADSNTAKVFAWEPWKKLPNDIQGKAREVLALIDNMAKVESLWTISGLKAHKLTVRGRANGGSVRINAQWRIMFDWDAEAQAADNVPICDCH